MRPPCSQSHGERRCTREGSALSSIRLISHQMRFDLKRFRRDPAGLFYGIGFPLVFLGVFLAAVPEEQATIAGRQMSNRPYYIAAIMTMTVVSLTFVNLAVSLTAARERGVLKRVRGTRLPPWVFMAARIGVAVAVTAAVAVFVVLLGWAVYGVGIPTTPLAGALLALLVAIASFSALAFALTRAMPSANACAAVAMTLTLVLYFLSGIFMREDNIPAWLRTVADVFPVKRLFESLVVAFDPATSGAAIRWTDLAVLAGWGVAGLLVALRSFRWTPRGD